MSEREVERHVEALPEGYRRSFISVLSERVRGAAEVNT